MALSTIVALFSTVVLSSNRCPLSGFLSFGNSQKSQGAMSGLYGGCTEAVQSCVSPKIAAQNSMNALARYRGKEASHQYFSVFRDHFLVHEQLINNHLHSQVAPAQHYPMFLSSKVGQNENHYQQKCGLLWNDYTTLLFVFCSYTNSQRPSATSE